MKLKKIYCIGDSHVSVFLGQDALAPIWPQKANSLLPYFEIFRIGPITAYNLSEKNSTTKGREKLETIIKNIDKKSIIILSAGEIDCRIHLLKQAKINNYTYREAANILATKYITFVNTIKELGYNICILLPPPTKYTTEDTIGYPTYGSEEQRNEITKILSNELIMLCEVSKIPFIGIFDRATQNNKTNKDYLWDGIHLSTKALPILIEQINQKIEINLPIPIKWSIREKIRLLIKYYNKYIKK
jgi:lysophospholipase L1-like esterase